MLPEMDDGATVVHLPDGRRVTLSPEESEEFFAVRDEWEIAGKELDAIVERALNAMPPAMERPTSGGGSIFPTDDPPPPPPTADFDLNTLAYLKHRYAADMNGSHDA
jgi:hypothetical protein